MISPQKDALGACLPGIGCRADFPVQGLVFIDLLPAFFVIVSSQWRMNTHLVGAAKRFCTKLSTKTVG
jgi:hypothetical protein